VDLELALDGHRRQASQGLERAGDENDLVFLSRMPCDAGDAFLEERNGVGVTEGQSGVHAGEVSLVAVLNGEKAMRQEMQRFDAPAQKVRERNGGVLAQFREETALEGRLRQKSSSEIENRSDASAGFGVRER